MKREYYRDKQGKLYSVLIEKTAYSFAEMLAGFKQEPCDKLPPDLIPPSRGYDQYEFEDTYLGQQIYAN